MKTKTKQNENNNFIIEDILKEAKNEEKNCMQFNGSRVSPNQGQLQSTSTSTAFEMPLVAHRTKYAN